MSQPSYNDTLPIEQKYQYIENRNFLSPIGFEFTVSKMPGVQFFCQAASIPAISTAPAIQGTRLNKIYQPGDELYYEPLFVKFLIDENMKNYYQVHDWIREITTPYSAREFGYDRGTLKSINKDTRERQIYINGNNDWLSDASLYILSSNYRPVAEFVFKDCFPLSLTTLNFDASVPDVNYFTAEVKIRYNYFDYFIYEAAEATDASMKPNYRVSEKGVLLD